VSEPLPASVLADAQRVLDAAARRLLAARVDGDAIGPAAGSDVGALDDGADESAALLESEQVPVPGRNGDGRRGSLG
jgi:hypothetical protein